MGVPRGTIRLLLDEAKRRPFSGTVLELGRMSIFATDSELAGWAKEQGVELAPVADPALSHDPRLAALGCLDDVTFFRRLGFERVESLDVSAWEKPDKIWDLNRPVPEEWHGLYDCVFESGTIQHVFHLPNVLANMHALVKPGGRVVHGQAPSHNHVDHGFYMFSPTLFWDYWKTNGYEIDAAYWFQFEPFWFRSKFASAPWRIRRYLPGSLDEVSYGGLDRRQISLFFVVTRGSAATSGVIPQQSYYERFWSVEATERMDAEAQQRLTGAGRLARIEAGLRPGSFGSKLWFTWKRLRSFVVQRLPPRLPKVDLRY